MIEDDSEYQSNIPVSRRMRNLVTTTTTNTGGGGGRGGYVITINPDEHGMEIRQKVRGAITQILNDNLPMDKEVEYIMLIVNQLVQDYNTNVNYMKAKENYQKLKKDNKSIIKCCCCFKCCFGLLYNSFWIMVYVTFTIAFLFVCVNLFKQMITG